MREIKFRTWDKKRDEMVFFDLEICNAETRLWWWEQIAGNDTMQFTGLRDKNGKEIFEGDILGFTVFDCYDHDTQHKGVIVYSGSRFMAWKSQHDEYYGNDGGFDLDWLVSQDAEIEVIGNLHENPELIECAPECAR